MNDEISVNRLGRGSDEPCMISDLIIQPVTFATVEFSSVPARIRSSADASRVTVVRQSAASEAGGPPGALS